MKIDEKKLAALHAYLVAGGSPEQVDVATQLGFDVDDEAAVEAYVEALKAKWPKIYGAADKPAAKKAAKQVETPVTYRLRKPDGTVAALEVIGGRNGTVILEEPRPTDKVTIMLKGQPVEVDLIELRAKKPLDKVHGLEVHRLLDLAELAKA